MKKMSVQNVHRENLPTTFEIRMVWSGAIRVNLIEIGRHNFNSSSVFFISAIFCFLFFDCNFLALRVFLTLLTAFFTLFVFDDIELDARVNAIFF